MAAIIVSVSSSGVIGISCITNMAAGILNQKLSHEEISAAADAASAKFARLLEACVSLSD